MITLLKNGQVFVGGKFEKLDVLLANDRIEALAPSLAVPSAPFAIFTRKDLELIHVIAKGKFFLKSGRYAFKNKTNMPTRDVDTYETHEKAKH